MMEFVAQVENLPEMLGFVTEQAMAAGMKGEKLGKIELALEEALVNVIYHAYPQRGAPTNRVSIVCTAMKDSYFKVTIADHGIPFNPCDKVVTLQNDVPIEERTVGGLGIYLMRQLVYKMEYERIKGENFLHLTFS